MITVETQGAVTVLTPDVPLNAEAAEPLLAALHAPASPGLPQVVLDLSGVAIIDSAGLEAVLDARAEVRGRGGVIKLAGARPLVADILVATGVGDTFEMLGSTKAAVGSFSR
ncbi:MAG: STAS domain-containing protein [Planctomycetota bacterium]